MAINSTLTKTCIISLIVCTGCTTIEPASVRARVGAPEAARVDRLEIPFDESLPRYALSVQTFVKEGPVGEISVKNHEYLDQHDRISSGWKKDTQSNNQLSEYDIDTQRDNVLSERRESDSRNPTRPAPENHGSATISPAVLRENQEQSNDLSIQQQRTKSTFDRNIKIDRSIKGSEQIASSSQNHDHLTKQKDSSTLISARSWEVDRRDINISAQFTSALAGVRNFQLMDPSAINSQGDGRYSAKLPPNVQGPFIVKALVTEEVYEVDGNNSKILIPGIVSTSSSEMEGVVVLDITVLDGRTGALVTAFASEGTFKSRDNKAKVGLLVPFSERRSFARSVISQAQRVALNDASRKIFQALAEYPAAGS